MSYRCIGQQKRRRFSMLSANRITADMEYCIFTNIFSSASGHQKALSWCLERFADGKRRLLCCMVSKRWWGLVTISCVTEPSIQSLRRKQPRFQRKHVDYASLLVILAMIVDLLVQVRKASTAKKNSEASNAIHPRTWQPTSILGTAKSTMPPTKCIKSSKYPGILIKKQKNPSRRRGNGA